MSLFGNFDQIEKFVVDAMSFLTAISGSLDTLHSKVDSVTNDVAVLKTAPHNVDSVGASIGALNDVLAKSAEILGAVNALHGVVAALPLATPIAAPVAETAPVVETHAA